MDYYIITKDEWDSSLLDLNGSHAIFAPVPNEYGNDYEPVSEQNIGSIAYNKPKPSTSLKTFFLPFRENVTAGLPLTTPRIIIGIPNCDIEGLNLLDEIYLDKDFKDIFYRERRERTTLIATDCYSTEKHCHCTSYGVKPYSERTADLSVAASNGNMIITTFTEKGNIFIQHLHGAKVMSGHSALEEIDKKRAATEQLLANANNKLPAYIATGKLIESSDREIWHKYSSKCVSCGACTTICPTCTCFLLIDRPGFEKVKQNDTCQYPGFERVAGGEDPLHEISGRFRNRYMCKYYWRPRKFKSLACTGCGRCIEACIGKINKNELFMELAG